MTSYNAAPSPLLTGTQGKIPMLSPQEGGPALWSHGCGSRFTDGNGREWIDIDLALGSVTWGHSNEKIAQAVATQLSKGVAPTVPSMIEHQARDQLLKRLAQFKDVWFAKTGADACGSAVRLSRLIKKKPVLFVDGYHGWHDWSASKHYQEDVSIGVPAATADLSIKLDPTAPQTTILDLIQKHADHASCIVLRPEAWDVDVFVRVCEAARRLGILIVFDEVTSHFKFGFQGSGAAKGQQPDFLCIGKGLANGLPLAALLSKVYLSPNMSQAKISTTNASESVSLAGMIAAEKLLDSAEVWPSWRRSLNALVEKLQTLIEEHALSGLQIVHYPGFFWIERVGMPFKEDPFRFHLVQALASRNVYSRGWCHGSDAHSQGDWHEIENAFIHALRSWEG